MKKYIKRDTKIFEPVIVDFPIGYYHVNSTTLSPERFNEIYKEKPVELLPDDLDDIIEDVKNIRECVFSTCNTITRNDGCVPDCLIDELNMVNKVIDKLTKIKK